MAPIVSVTGGDIRGFIRDGVSVFLGIPYAAAPVGPARWELPRPVAKWEGVRSATEFGATCVQAPYPPPIHALLGSDGIPGDEYLNVNVWTPDPGGSGLPVLVWIHGGAFTRGSNARQIYDGGAFARDGIVVVSINYRLGASGFAAVPGAPLNRGLHDQIFALRWVRDNVAAFGGDPDQVTIFGESAGGMSVVNLLAAPAARGLFRRAIVQSGNGSGVCEAQDAVRLGEVLADRLGIEASAEAFGRVSARQLLEAQNTIGLELMINPDPARWGASVLAGGLGLLSFFPVIDGELLPARPIDVVAAQSNRVPLLAGWTAEEFRFFTFPTGIAAGITDDTLSVLLPRYGLDPAIADIYRAERPGAGAADLYAAILTDAIFRDDVTRLAETPGATHLYEFAWPSALPDLGACHVIEVPFVFDQLAAAHNLTGPNPPQALADETHAAWVRFATHGDPGWAAATSESLVVHRFDFPESTDAIDPRGEELRALRKAHT
ncbi:carboxylesterase/lipase family protein [Nocardia pseudobrasiliensis]|uniref:Carboxylic ester hydrolase n=1 Tax=Nocardia pseudobrasiliensis TaxID=45979 RepID=A0A370IG43_9NOCA|nr:carboxylesterase family protein [Nocardia pseudobrasiliensis]RDI69121.1 para-nitrobenzyl esterase [Nocardia pseudobrasiliensis]